MFRWGEEVSKGGSKGCGHASDQSGGLLKRDQIIPYPSFERHSDYGLILGKYQRERGDVCFECPWRCAGTGLEDLCLSTGRRKKEEKSLGDSFI